MTDLADHLRNAIKTEQLPITTIKEVLQEFGFVLSEDIFRRPACEINSRCDGPGEVPLPLPGTGKVWK